MPCQQIDLGLAVAIAQWNIKSRATEIPVVFGNLIFQNQVIAKRVPGQFVDETMILVQIMTVVCQNNIGIDSALKTFELIFYLAADVREIPVLEIVYMQVAFHGATQK